MPNSGSEERLSKLVGSLYDAALDPALWPTAAATVAAELESPSVCFQLRSAQSVSILAASENFEARFLADYQAYYYQHDLWVHRALEMGLGQIWRDQDLVPDTLFERSEFYCDHVRPAGIRHILGVALPLFGQEVACVGIHRDQTSGRYDETEKHLAEQLRPHLQRSFQISSKLSGAAVERHAALDALARLKIATLVVDATSRLLYANPIAESLLRAQDGLKLLQGRLITGQRSLSDRLRHLVRTAVAAAGGAEEQAGAGGVLALPRLERLPLTVLVAPFPPAKDGFGAPVPAAILFIRDPEIPTAAGHALQGLFGLTATEAKVAHALAQGQAVEKIARLHGISLNTARTHLKNVMAKTATTRQAELVSLILRSIAMLHRPDAS